MKKFFKGAQRGMTLIEIMIVLAIIGFIMGLVGVNVMKQFKKGQIRATETQIKAFEQGLEAYFAENNSYPTTEQGLEILAGEYLKGKNIPKDAWKNPYKYMSPGSDGGPWEIMSYGPDKTEGTEDDLSSVETEEEK